MLLLDSKHWRLFMDLDATTHLNPTLFEVLLLTVSVTLGWST